MDVGAIISLVFAVVIFIVFPLIGIVGAIMIEMTKARRSGVDVESIIRDARKRAYERGRQGE